MSSARMKTILGFSDDVSSGEQLPKRTKNGTSRIAGRVRGLIPISQASADCRRGQGWLNFQKRRGSFLVDYSINESPEKNPLVHNKHKAIGQKTPTAETYRHLLDQLIKVSSEGRKSPGVRSLLSEICSGASAGISLERATCGRGAPGARAHRSREWLLCGAGPLFCSLDCS